MGSGNGIRLSLIGVNIFFLLGGLVLLGLGIWVQVEKGDYVAIADSDTGLSGAILLIVVGAVTAVIAIVGLFGAFKRKSVLLWIFFSVLVIIVIVQIVAVILGMLYRQKVEDELRGDMLKTIQEYATDVEGVTKAWDWAQQKFECCGVDNYTNWRRSATFNPRGRHYLVPDSCCKEETEQCGDFKAEGFVDDVDKTKVYTSGCFIELKEYIKDHLLTIGLAALFFLILELVVIILTLMLVLKVARGSKIV